MGTTGQSITLANSIIGVGILAMPFCFQQCGVLLATLILMSMGLMSRLCCYFLLKSAIITRRRNYEFLAFHVFGPAGKMAVETGIIGFLMGTCIAYFVVVGDLGPQIIAKILNINQSDTLRTSIMVIVSLVCVLPLGLLRNVDSLSNVSAATIAFYFCLVIKVITEATTQLLTSDWHTRIEMWKPAGVLQCVPIFSMALFCQTQLFEIFESMPSVSLEKMCAVTRNAIHICSAVYLTLGLFGYIAFGSKEISGNILMSLSPTWASDVIKLGFVMSLAFSFPLIIFPCRASLYSFLYRKAHPSQHDHIINHSIPEGTFRLMTVGIVGAALVVSLLLPNVELVLGLLGATVGVLVCVVFPAACFLNVTYKDTNERLLAKFVVVLGLFILVLGTFANLQAAENTRDKYDDLRITKERIDKIVEDFFHQQEESEAAMAKPNLKVSMNPGKDKAVENEIIKDSEVQPPNPVPPESQSNEKNVHQALEGKKDDKPREALQETKDTLNKDTESHPRNLKLKTNGESIVKNDNNEDNLDNKNMENEKQEKISNSQEKSDILKQQQLMETIKQHGEEQKELIKEQKVILEEILKTKKELESKKEEENNEAKKIAVESIQKIANMAIKSIGGVTEKPINLVQDKKSAQLENIASAAVDEIAKKAVETLDAIKQINNPSNNVNKLIEIITNGEKENPEHIKEKLLQNQQNGAEQDKLIPNPVKQQADTAVHQINKGNVSQLNGGKLENSEKFQKRDVKQPESLSVEKKANEIKPAVKENSPSPLPEKASIEKNNQNNLKLNAPIAVALNGNETLNNGQQIQKVNDNPKVTNKETKNDMPTKDEKIVSARQKREVVDCTETTMLKPEDKQICENLVNKPVKDTSNLLPEVDLSEVGLAKNIPLGILSVHHIRSLKSYEETKKR